MGDFFFYLQEKKIVYGKGCWCCFLTGKGNETLFFFDGHFTRKIELTN